MNYLAHLFLAEDNPQSIIGNLLGDFVKGRLEQYKNIYNPEIIAGINISNTFKLLKTITNNDVLTIEINSKEIAELEIENVNSVETYVVVTLSDKIENIACSAFPRCRKKIVCGKCGT